MTAWRLTSPSEAGHDSNEITKQPRSSAAALLFDVHGLISASFTPIGPTKLLDDFDLNRFKFLQLLQVHQQHDALDDDDGFIDEQEDARDLHRRQRDDIGLVDQQQTDGEFNNRKDRNRRPALEMREAQVDGYLNADQTAEDDPNADDDRNVMHQLRAVDDDHDRRDQGRETGQQVKARQPFDAALAEIANDAHRAADGQDPAEDAENRRHRSERTGNQTDPDDDHQYSDDDGVNCKVFNVFFNHITTSFLPMIIHP